jgi:transcription initiation factor IIE alpha subunit
MADVDFDMRLKKEAKSSLQSFRDQSLLRRKFGDEAVKLYNLIDSGKTASGLMAALGMKEEIFIEILEFMNNNAMVSIVPSEPAVQNWHDAADGERASSGYAEESGLPDEPSVTEARPSSSARPISPRAPMEKEIDENSLSPLEKVLYRKHGSIGVRIYNLIDGEKTAEEILRETGVSEAKLVEILEFMDEQGIIKLEKPEEKAPPSGGSPGSGDGDDDSDGGEDKGDDGGEGEEKPAREPRFKPIVEDVPEGKPFQAPEAPKKEDKQEKKEEIDEPGEDIVMVDVPAFARLSMLQKAMMFTELSTKFPPAARQLFDMVDGKRDFVELSLSTGMLLFDIDSAMAYFGKKGFITFRQLDRNEIRDRYGEDGFAIYKRFGRDGLIIYEMIGKEASLRDIILKSKIDPDRAIEIFSFIHKVLGLDIPLDRDLIYRQIGLKK